MTLTDTQIRNIERGGSYDVASIQAAITDGDYGTLIDTDTTEEIRPATLEECLQSLDASEYGSFRLDGRSVYVGW